MPDWVKKGNLRGQQGQQGPPGDDGADGRGVQSTDINTGGHLILTYTDAVQVDLGDVTGEDGSSVQIAGSVATYADLPTGLGEADTGKGWMTDDTGLLYVWNGTSFPAQGAGLDIRGPQGPQGIQGTPGADGLRGSQWKVQASDPPATPGAGVLVGDLWLNSDTGEFFQLQEV